LLDEHFTGSLVMQGPPVKVKNSFILNDAIPHSHFNEKKVQLAINSFSPYKAPGPDGLPPVVLKALGPKMIYRLTCLYRAMMALAFTLSIWRQSRVIFIPKPGKTNYSEPRAFRPISLMPFLFKVFEKLNSWAMETTSLTRNPMNSSQHGFRRGFSTDSALSEVVNRIESSIYRGKFSLCVFLDIKGAFDNVKTTSIIRGMESKDISPEIIAWYKQYLLNRSIVTDVQGIKVSRTVGKGTPQGGVLSAPAWNLSFDESL
jgi:hypothetical protein